MSDTTWRVTVRYLDEYDEPQKYEITGAGPLIYDDMMAEPLLVRRLAKSGITIKGASDPDRVSRAGSFIPPHRILRIWFEDNVQ